MAITHTKVAVLADCPAFCVGSGEWNDCHVIGNCTITNAQLCGCITNAKLANIITARIKGRITACTGVLEDLTAIQVRCIINVECGSTADQTNAEIKTAYEANVCTNEFSCAEQTKLVGIACCANLYVHPNHTGDVTSIADGVTTIVAGIIDNANINACAAIAQSKLVNILDADIDAHTTTKITTTSKSLLNADIVYTDEMTMKTSVRMATTANITLSGVQTFDGVTGVACDRVLVKNQTAGAENGLYLQAAGAWTRTTDFDTSAKTTSGALLTVQEGTVTADTIWQLTTNEPITLGTTSLTFTEFVGGGGSDTPWTEDHDADGFDLNDLSNIEFRNTTGAPASTVPAIYKTGALMAFNVATGDIFDFLVNGVSQLRVGENSIDFQLSPLIDISNITQSGTGASLGFIRMTNSEVINWRNNANTANFGISGTGTDDLQFDVATGDIFDFKINSVSEMTLSATTLNVQNNDITTVSDLIFGTTGITSTDARISADTGGMNFSVPASDDYSFHINGQRRAQINNSGFDASGFSLINLGSQTLAANAGRIRMTNTSAVNWRNAANTNNIGLTVDVSDDFVFAIDGSTEMTLSATALDLQNNNLTIGTGTINFGTGMSMDGDGTFFDIDVSFGGDQIRLRWGGGDEFIFTENDLDINNNSIVDVNRMEQFGTSASVGFVRMINTSAINWRNAGNTADFGITGAADDNIDYNVTTGNLHDFQINAVSQMTIASGLVDLVSGDLNISDSSSITWAGSADRRINNNTAGFIFEVEATDNFAWTIANTNEMTFDATNGLSLGRRFEPNKGADIASATTITLGNDGNFFDITGTTIIDFITTTSWRSGSVIILQFDASVTVRDRTISGAPGAGAADIALAGAANFSATADDTLTIVFDGTDWRELARSVN